MAVDQLTDEDFAVPMAGVTDFHFVGHVVWPGARDCRELVIGADERLLYTIEHPMTGNGVTFYNQTREHIELDVRIDESRDALLRWLARRAILVADLNLPHWFHTHPTGNSWMLRSANKTADTVVFAPRPRPTSSGGYRRIIVPKLRNLAERLENMGVSGELANLAALACCCRHVAEKAVGL